MARTPLYAAIKRMARDCNAAHVRGVPVAEVLAERTAAGISRRTLVEAGTGLAATLALARPGRAQGGPRIAIVGGGISGLNAALTLQDAGIAATVYEAGTRLGGRMYSNTNYWMNGQVSEWGGELVDTGHKTIIGLCQRFNLTLDDLKTNTTGQDTYYFFGKYYPVKQAYADWQNGIWQAIQRDQHAASWPTTYNSYTAAGQALDQMSVYDWIETRVPGGHASPMGAMLDAAYAIEFGADTTDQSALNIVYQLGFNKQTGGTAVAGSNGSFQMFGSSDERFHIHGGNAQLPLAIAAALASPVRMGYRLTALAKLADGTYSLTFSVGGRTSTVSADYVVLALPFAVLRALDYSRAGFDTLKNTAIQELGRGHNGKLQLQFDTRYWTGTGPWPGNSTALTYADTGYQNTWEVTRAQAGATGILVNYTGGSVCSLKTTTAPWAAVPDKHVLQDAQTFLAQLEPVLPGGKAQWNTLATSSLPFLDPLLNLAYSYWRKGQYTKFAGYEKVRQGNVFFAGEHTSLGFQGFMEGGAQEGARAAGEILTQLGKK
jgi:monoamine oxidase